MNPKNNLYFILLISFCALGVYLSQSFSPPQLKNPHIWLLLIFISLISRLSTMVVNQQSLKAPAAFVRTFMATTALKLMLYLAIIIVYALAFRPLIVSFLIYFLAFYLFFTAFETLTLFRSSKKKG